MNQKYRDAWIFGNIRVLILQNFDLCVWIIKTGFIQNEINHIGTVIFVQCCIFIPCFRYEKQPMSKIIKLPSQRTATQISFDFSNQILAIAEILFEVFDTGFIDGFFKIIFSVDTPTLACF